MFSKNKKLFSLVFYAFLTQSGVAVALDTVQDVSADSLPINVAGSQALADTAGTTSNALVSPTKPTTVVTENPAKEIQNASENKGSTGDQQKQVSQGVEKEIISSPEITDKKEVGETGNNFDFDLKMKSIDAKAKSPQSEGNEVVNNAGQGQEAELSQNIQYKATPLDNLGNSILSQLDNDLFSQMSELEKSTTLLTLELRREKIRNEIEAQKAIRKKNIDDLEKQKEEERLKSLEKEKQIEANVFKEKQLLLDKQQLFEVVKQRKLLNAYMNQMLISQQNWLKEKESLYAQIAAVEDEKKELIASFKSRIDKILDVSIKNIQRSEAAKANFERVVKLLKARNDQLRRRVEADAKIIKGSKNSLQSKSQTIDELKSKAVLAKVETTPSSEPKVEVSEASSIEEFEKINSSKVSNSYAILGIIGQGNNMSAELIDEQGQPITIKVGSMLPSGHSVSEIGSDFVKFNSDNGDDYLYIGRSIDGVVPTIGLVDNKGVK